MAATVVALGEQMLWVPIPKNSTDAQLEELVYESLRSREPDSVSLAGMCRVSLPAAVRADPTSHRQGFLTLTGRDIDPSTAVCEIAVRDNDQPAETTSNWTARHLGPMRRTVVRSENEVKVRYETVGAGLTVQVDFMVENPSLDYPLLRDSEVLINDLLLRQDRRAAQ